MGWYDLLLNCLSQEVSQARGSPSELVSIKYQVIKMTISNRSVCTCSRVSQTRNIFLSIPSTLAPGQRLCPKPHTTLMNIVKNRDIAKALTRSKVHHITIQLITKSWQWCCMHTDNKQALWNSPYKAAAKCQAQDEDEYPCAKDDYVNIQN